jgi:hypothetical protein
VKEAAHRELWFCVPRADSGHYAAARFANRRAHMSSRSSSTKAQPLAVNRLLPTPPGEVASCLFRRDESNLSFTIRSFVLGFLFVAAIGLFPFSGRDEDAPEHGSNRYRDDNKQARPTCFRRLNQPNEGKSNQQSYEASQTQLRNHLVRP